MHQYSMKRSRTQQKKTTSNQYRSEGVLLYHYAEGGKMVIHRGEATEMVDFVDVNKMVDVLLASANHQKPFCFMRS